MSITDELREWAEDNTLQDMVLTTYPPQHAVRGVLETLLRIADRIDAEHERLMQEQPFTIDMVPMTDEHMAEHGWARLPKDTGGEYVNVGDWIINPDISNRKHKVAAITPESVYWWGEDGCHWRYSHLVRHYHEPTVEDVLEKALNEAAMLDRQEGYWPSAADITNIVNSLADKLQLREDA